MKYRFLTTLLLPLFLFACNLGSAPETVTNPTLIQQVPHITVPDVSLPANASGIIFHNGVILTMNRDQPAAEAILIQGDTVQAVGGNAEILAMRGGSTTVIDLGGLTLMPGFVDAHSHLFGDNFLSGQDSLPDQQVAIDYGVTTIAEFYVDQSLLNMLKTLADAGKLRMRVNAYLLYTTNCGDLMGDWWKAYQPNQQIAPNLYVRGIKIFTDGGSCKIPAMSVDYPGGLGKGDLFFTQEQLNQMVAEVQAAGFQVAIHAAGDRAVEQSQNAIASALNGQPNIFRHRIEHNGTIRPELLPRYTQIGIVPIIFGAYPTCARTTGESKFKYFIPPEYGAWDWPWRALVDANPDLPIAWQADYHVFGTINPLYHMWGMVTRKEVNTDGSICNPPDWLKAGALRVEEVLPMMTRNSAYALFFEKEVGSLEAGKLADLVILSDNPLSVESDSIKDITVFMTMINGKVEFCAAGREALCPSASPADFEPAATAPTFTDNFDGALADGWTWLREDASAYSLTTSPGWLRINLSTSSYLKSLPSNVLTRAAPQGDFDIRTSVRFTPASNFEFAGLIILFDEKTVLQFGRAFCNLGSCPGSGYYFDNLQNGVAVGGDFSTAGSSPQSLLRLVREGSLYTAYHQVDNVNWVQIGSHSMDRQPLSFGLIAAQAPSAGNYAEFDWFEISSQP